MASVNSGIANTRFVWAPEFFVEGNTVRVIVSVAQTTCSNCFRPYVYTAQNSNLTSWSGPVQMDGLGVNYIDTFVVRSGNTYHAFVKNETSKYIEHWTSSSSLTSGWTSRGALWSSGYEGPALLQMPNGAWRIYVDRYTNGGIWTATSSDLNTWSGLSAVSCAGCRHGTVLAVASSSPAERYRVTARHSGKVIDVIGASTADNAEVKQWSWNGGANQAWAFEDVGGGYLRIVNQNSGKCLDVAGVSTADGANIIQYTCNGAANQQWQWRPIDNYFQLVARHSGKCLDVVSAGTGDGADIQQYACGSQHNQQWSRSPI